jgi:glycine hydroxymethyltransferase
MKESEMTRIAEFIDRVAQAPDDASVTGKATDIALDRAHITCNKNGIPFDTTPFTITSGVRLGTPAGTTRGFGQAEFRQIGQMIAQVVDALSVAGEGGDTSMAEEAVKKQALELCARFPIYG